MVTPCRATHMHLDLCFRGLQQLSTLAVHMPFYAHATASRTFLFALDSMRCSAWCLLSSRPSAFMATRASFLRRSLRSAARSAGTRWRPALLHARCCARTPAHVLAALLTRCQWRRQHQTPGGWRPAHAHVRMCGWWGWGLQAALQAALPSVSSRAAWCGVQQQAPCVPHRVGDDGAGLVALHLAPRLAHRPLDVVHVTAYALKERN